MNEKKITLLSPELHAQMGFRIERETSVIEGLENHIKGLKYKMLLDSKYIKESQRKLKIAKKMLDLNLKQKESFSYENDIELMLLAKETENNCVSIETIDKLKKNIKKSFEKSHIGFMRFEKYDKLSEFTNGTIYKIPLNLAVDMYNGGDLD